MNKSVKLLKVKKKKKGNKCLPVYIQAHKSQGTVKPFCYWTAMRSFEPDPRADKPLAHVHDREDD